MPNQIDKPDIKLVRALQKDFKELYHPKYTASHKEKQMLINIELGIMQLKNLERYILKHYISRDEVMGLLPQKRGDAVKQEEMIPFDSKYRVEMHWLRKCQNAGYNQAISDMRQALTTNEEE